MTNKHQVIKLRQEAGRMRRKLQTQMRRFSPFDDRYLRLEMELEKIEKQWQQRKKAEAEFGEKGER